MLVPLKDALHLLTPTHHRLSSILLLAFTGESRDHPRTIRPVNSEPLKPLRTTTKAESLENGLVSSGAYAQGLKTKHHPKPPQL